MFSPAPGVSGSDAETTIPLPIPRSELTFAWPHISTTGSQTGTNTLSSSGESENFLDIKFDVDQYAATIFPLLFPLDPDPISDDNFELLDLDLNGGLNFVQNFILTASGLKGTITFQDGTTEGFSFLEDRMIRDASRFDVDNDDLIEFTLSLTPDATLRNETDLGFNVGYSFDLLKNIPIIEDTLWSPDGDATVPIVSVYDETFQMAGFAAQQYGFVV